MIPRQLAPLPGSFSFDLPGRLRLPENAKLLYVPRRKVVARQDRRRDR